MWRATLYTLIRGQRSLWRPTHVNDTKPKHFTNANTVAPHTFHRNRCLKWQKHTNSSSEDSIFIRQLFLALFFTTSRVFHNDSLWLYSFSVAWVSVVIGAVVMIILDVAFRWPFPSTGLSHEATRYDFIVHSAVRQYKLRSCYASFHNVAESSCNELTLPKPWVFGVRPTLPRICIVRGIQKVLHLAADRSACRPCSFYYTCQFGQSMAWRRHAPTFYSFRWGLRIL